MSFVLDRKNYIAVVVIGYLIRGMIYHFFPLINEILLWITILWPLLILGNDIRNRRWKPDRFQLPLCLFLLAALVSTVVNLRFYIDPNIIEPIDAIYSIVQGVALVLILLPYAKEEQSETTLTHLFRIIWSYVVLLAAGSIALLICYKLNISLPGGLSDADHIFTYGHMGEETRFCGLFGYSTDGGNLCAMAAVLTLYLYQHKQLPRVISVIGLFLLMYTIYLLDVRTSMVELLAVGIVIAFLWLKKRFGTWKTIVVIALVLGIGIVGLLVLKQDAIQGYLAMYREDPRKTVIFLTTGRSEYWEYAWNGFLARPLLGWGWLNNSAIGYFDNHNLFFNLLYWTGGIGTLSVLWFTVLVIRECFQGALNGRYSLGLIILAIGVQSMLDRAILGTAHTAVETMVFWLVLGLLIYGGEKKRSG